MSPIPHITAAVAAALLLAGCAASHAPIARTAPSIQTPAAIPTPADPAEKRAAADAAYMARVEEIARRRGIAVQWVHPPLTRVAVAD